MSPADPNDDDGRNAVLVHDWLTGMRGGEKCLEVLCRRWPAARLYTLLHARGRVSPAIERLGPRTSPLQWLPGVGRYYRYLLPVMPLAAGWRLTDCGLVVSFSHCVAKAAVPPPGVPHVSYCFTPMRYAWHMRRAYFDGRPTVAGRVRDAILARLREWDRRVSDRVTHFVAISRTVRDRIRECYGRDSVVIYPPVHTSFYTPALMPREDYYLAVSAFAPYKRLDLAIAACRRLGRRLVVIGTGQDAARLQAAAGDGVEFLGWQPDAAIRDHLRRCRALLFPGEEDFGIVPLEAMACGTPVIAYNRGGATETVLPAGVTGGPTGVLFDEQTEDGLVTALEAFERDADRFDPRAARRQALRFSASRYEAELMAYLAAVRGGRGEGRRAA
jgi:glycosyltransferase involved in cell wall biosynthesis